MAVNLSTLLPPDVIETPDYDALVAKIKEYFVRKNTDYTAIVESDPGYTMMEGAAYIGTLIFARINDAAKALLITHATGADLEILAAPFNVARRDGETDDMLRERAINALENIVPGSPAWYQNYAVESSPEVINAKALRKPDPNDPTKDIAGECIVYIQQRGTVIPTAQTLQTARNYINAVGHDYGGDTEAEELAEQRRFINDIVNVESVNTSYYVLCAEIHVLPGLDRLTVLQETQGIAQDFVDRNTRIGQKIPLSSIYASIDTESVAEVTLTYPTADIVTDKITVPQALPQQDLNNMPYKAFGTWQTFGDTTDAGFTLGTYNGDGYVIFTQDISASDKAKLQNVRACNRIGIYEVNDQGNPTELLHTYRVEGMQMTFTNANSRVHIHFHIEGTPLTTGLTADETYAVSVLNSVELTVAGI